MAGSLHLIYNLEQDAILKDQIDANVEIKIVKEYSVKSSSSSSSDNSGAIAAGVVVPLLILLGAAAGIAVCKYKNWLCFKKKPVEKN